MARLTQTQKNQIIIEAAEGISIQEQVRKYNASYQTIKHARQSDPKLLAAAKKRVETTRDSIIAHMESLRPEVNTLLDEYIAAMHSQAKRDSASLVQLATALGILIDKFGVTEKNRSSETEENNLFDALDKVSAEEDIDGISELQPAPESVDAVVENKETEG